MVQRFNTPAVRNLGDRWYEHPDFARYSFSAGIRRINEAVDGFLLSLGLRHDRKNSRYEVVGEVPERVALFAHQGFGMLFFSSLLDIPYPFFCTHFDFGHSSMTVVNFERQGAYIYPKVLQLSNDSHLYREGILTGYHNVIRF
jgi:broad specificity phosphatase PhoE